MSESRWEELQALFDQVIKLPESQRSRFLDEACGDDSDLRAEIDALLRADTINRSEPHEPRILRTLRDPDSGIVGTSVDGWHILERIGVGGMGSVYLAERADAEFDQRVALKIVKRGLDSEEVLQRFRQERQILARLHHANIASLLDGGITEDGRPYFAMEHVDGLPITEYCDRNRLDVEARLTLFQKVCDAVHYAHQSLVVHRDLKPSNIIVTPEGDLKLLDFGIAKLLDEPDDSHLTKTGMQVHTPAYAAPEQFTSGAITTVTDVYALGIVLYELLSGRRPFEIRRTPEEMRELVLTGTPPKPSAAVLQLPLKTDKHIGTKTVEELSALRSAKTDRLRKTLSGDLDTICLMAMHREPDHRYPSADQLAADIRRHLSGLPVVASPDSVTYRVAKFCRRHRAAVVSTLTAIAAFVSLSVFYTVQLAHERDKAIEERQKADEVVDFVTGLFEVSDPSESKGEELTAKDLLDAGAIQIGTELADRPAIQSLMRRVLGEVYYSLGTYEPAEQLVSDALAQQLELYGDNHLDVARSKIALAIMYKDRGDYDEATRLIQEALDTTRALLPGDHYDLVDGISILADFEETGGNYEAAERLYIEALRMSERLAPGDDSFVAESMAALGRLYRILDRNDEAEALFRDALAMQKRLYDGPHKHIDNTKRRLAALLRDSGHHSESKTLLAEVIESRTRMFGPDHLSVANVWNTYSSLLADMGDHEGAIEANGKTIAIMERAYNGPHPSLGAAYHNFATLLSANNELDRALETFQRAIDIQDGIELAPRHPNRTYPLVGIAAIYLKQHRYSDAERIFREALAIRREHFAEDHRGVLDMKSSLAVALTGQEKFAEAEELLHDAYVHFTANRGADDRRTQRAVRRLISLYEAKGDEEKAERYRRLRLDNPL